MRTRKRRASERQRGPRPAQPRRSSLAGAYARARGAREAAALTPPLLWRAADHELHGRPLHVADGDGVVRVVSAPCGGPQVNGQRATGARR